MTIGETEDDAANQERHSPAVCGYQEENDGNFVKFSCPHRMYGRYVRITKIGGQKTGLSVFEIEVNGF